MKGFDLFFIPKPLEGKHLGKLFTLLGVPKAPPTYWFFFTAYGLNCLTDIQGRRVL